MILTVWCVAVVLGSVLAAGIPLCWLCNGRKPLTAFDYVQAPFVGIAALTLVLQNLVYLNVPLKLSTPFVWLALLALWMWFGSRGALRGALARAPLVLAAACLVYFLQGSGLFRAGAASYAGRAWTDQYNYTTLAQFLMDKPFHTGLEDLEGEPYLVPAVFLKDDRIGQSVLHGFFATTCFEDAKTLFEPTILLAPALLVLAIHAVCLRLGFGRRFALAAAFTAGLLPAITLLHLESFLSHSLAIPFLLLWPVLLVDLSEDPGWRQLIRPALVLTAGCCIYAEMWPLLMAIPVVILGPAVLRSARRRPLLLSWAGLCLAPLLLNLGMARTLGIVLRRLDSTQLGAVYPWAFTAEAWGRLWVGDLAHDASGRILPIVRLITLTVSGLAYCGWIYFAIHVSLRRASPRRLCPGGVRAGFALCLAGLVMLPIAVVVRDREHPYQFYKLLLTISPLLMLGCPLLCRSLIAARDPAATSSRPVVLMRRLAAPLSVAAILVMSLIGTGSMVRASVHLTPAERSLAHRLRAPDFAELCKRLVSIRGNPFILAASDAVTDGWYNGWMAYFARNNYVRVLNPEINDIEPYRVPEAHKALSPDRFPERGHILVSRPKAFHAAAPEDATLLWTIADYQLWQTNGSHWAFPLCVMNPNGIEQVEGQPFFWLGEKSARLEVLTGCPGELTFRANFRPGPSLPGTTARKLRIHTDAGRETIVVTHAGTASFTMPVSSGRTTIFFSSLDRPTASPPPGGDTRTLLLGVHGLHIQFTPESDKVTR